MATETFPHSSFGGGIVRVEVDINTANWKAVKMRCVNDSAHAASATILEGGAPVFEASAPANATTIWNVAGVQLGWDSVDGGIMMGNFVMQAQWPSGA